MPDEADEVAGANEGPLTLGGEIASGRPPPGQEQTGQHNMARGMLGRIVQFALEHPEVVSAIRSRIGPMNTVMPYRPPAGTPGIRPAGAVNTETQPGSYGRVPVAANENSFGDLRRELASLDRSLLTLQQGGMMTQGRMQELAQLSVRAERAGKYVNRLVDQGNLPRSSAREIVMRLRNIHSRLRHFHQLAAPRPER